MSENFTTINENWKKELKIKNEEMFLKSMKILKNVSLNELLYPNLWNDKSN
jgi:hypothetical protein